LKGFEMANMSYCRFENTLNSMKDCLYAIEENNYSIEEYIKQNNPSEYEMSAIREMADIAEELINVLKDLK